MAWFPISGLAIQRLKTDGKPASGYVLKFYAAGTSTNIPMATDSTGATQANTATFNANGDLTISGNVILPHIDQDYKYAIYPNQASADANSGAVFTTTDIALATLSIDLASLGITASAAELNKLDGATVSTAEINQLAGVSSPIQSQLDGKVAGVGVSVDKEIMLFDGTTGKQAERATETGILKAASGVIGVAVSGTDIKTVNGNSLLGSGNIATQQGALVILGTPVVASGASQVDVETGFSSTYDDYIIEADIESLSGLDSIRAQWKLGGAYDTGSNYFDPTANSSDSSAAASLIVTNTNSSALAGGIHYRLYGVNSAVTKHAISQAVTRMATPAVFMEVRGHGNSGTGILSGVRFFCAGGATITGTFRLYGLAKS